MPIEDFAGLKLHTQTLGRLADPVVLLVHGFITGSISSWHFTVAPALAPDHRIARARHGGYVRKQPTSRGSSTATPAASR